MKENQAIAHYHLLKAFNIKETKFKGKAEAGRVKRQLGQGLLSFFLPGFEFKCGGDRNCCLGDDDCCKDKKCGPNEGDCDSSADCQPGLFCGVDNCRYNSFGILELKKSNMHIKIHILRELYPSLYPKFFNIIL